MLFVSLVLYVRSRDVQTCCAVCIFTCVHDAAQPVLLTTTKDMANAASCLMAVDGADVAPEEVQRLERVCVLFDGNLATSLDAARGQWKALTDAGCSAQYWSEASGRWEKKAEK